MLIGRERIEFRLEPPLQVLSSDCVRTRWKFKALDRNVIIVAIRGAPEDLARHALSNESIASKILRRSTKLCTRIEAQLDLGCFWRQ